ncbi:hypothetical protein HJC23_005174 [Cyclotella cryptica]|uniref:Uncharacterized protein n=1 Tax=Cyclotella cryptica TaxID=29204 RepID=A0ABD3QMU7_9STRA
MGGGQPRPQRARKEPAADGTVLVLVYVECEMRSPDASVSASRVRSSIHGTERFGWCDNDPSAGSPTETLLRLHLPLDDKVWRGSRGQIPMKEPSHNPDSSPDHPIGRCDGRCVQRAGT